MLSRRALLVTAAAVLAAASPSVASSVRKSPAWLSIESPVNPYDPATRGAVLLVHAQFHDGNARLADLSGSAEGIVRGARRSVPLRFDSTSRSSVFGVKRQWPAEGTWLLRIALKGTTAIVTFDAAGNAVLARVPTESSTGMPLPRAVGARPPPSPCGAVAKYVRGSRRAP